MKKKIGTILLLCVGAICAISIYGNTTDTPKHELISKEDFYYQEIKDSKNTFKQLTRLAQQQLASVVSSDEHILIPATFTRQEHPLTCEIASLRMALNVFQHDVTEEDLLYKLKFDVQTPRTSKNIWGDPDKGFVGDVDGSVRHGTGYGTYDTPIRDVALYYRNAERLQKATLSGIITEIESGNPVIVWGLLASKNPLYWKTKHDKTVEAFYGEHARVLIGYTGTKSNPQEMILMDPLYGKIKMNTDRFVQEWKELNNRAVVVYKN